MSIANYFSKGQSLGLFQRLDSDLTAIAALAPSDGTFLRRTGGVWVAAALVSADLTTALTTPPAIGGTTPAAGSFTTLTLPNSGALSLGSGSSMNFDGSNLLIAVTGSARAYFNIPAANGSAGSSFVLNNPGTGTGTGSGFLFNAGSNGSFIGGMAATRIDAATNSRLVFRVLAAGAITQFGVTDIPLYIDGGAPMSVVANATLRATVPDTATNTVTNALTLGHNTSGTPAASFGTGLLFQGETTTTIDTNMVRVRALWTTETHASRKARGVLSAYDTAERDAIMWEASGSAAMIGFLGTAPTIRQTGYTTFANLSTDRTCDADTVLVAELADIVGTLIEDLKAKGLIAA